jgi:uncharacterized protein (TIGR00288 family)
METRFNGPQIAIFFDFENVATSAEANFGTFDVTTVMELLRSRGRLLVKRAYADWGRFQRYRRPMLENGIDLFQLYSVGIQQKNRADVRLAIDALEVVFTRPNIDIYAVVSGDSDFTELIHKLRDYGKYTIGIGLRSATSDLLRRACDEFIFYDTLVSEELDDLSDELQLPEARLLHRALAVAEQKGELPIFAGRLKQIMLGLDSSFNEANYGFQQFRAFLEAHSDLVNIEESGLQVYVTPQTAASGQRSAVVPASAPPVSKPVADMGQRYRSFLREANLRVVDASTRRAVLADFVATVKADGESFSVNAAADLLKDRYDEQNAMTLKIAVPEMMRLLIMSGALSCAGGEVSGDAPLRHVASLDAEILAGACAAVYVWRLVEGGVPVFEEPLAPVLYGVDADAGPVRAICSDLVKREMIVSAGDSYMVAPAEINRLLQRDELQLTAAGLHRVTLPVGEPISPITAESLFREASELRQKDFAGSAHRYLQAARIQLEALKAGQPRTGYDDLKWYLASYCSVKAGHAFVTANYAEAIPYYLAFFGLAREPDSVWPRIQRLVNPMSSYYFAISGKQLDETVLPNLGRSPACQVALHLHNHANPQVGEAWEALMTKLACVNLGVIRLTCHDLIGMVGPLIRSENVQLEQVERTRAFLLQLIAEHERDKGGDPVAP